MRHLFCIYLALVLVLVASSAYAITEDFSDGVVSDPDPNWTSVDGWIYNQANWQVVVNPNNGDQGYQCVGSSQAAGQRGLTMLTDSSYKDFAVEADIYNLVDEVGVAVRGIEHFTGGWETITFYIHEWGIGGGAGAWFNWFYPFDGAPAEAWGAPKGFANWNPIEGAPHGIDRIHVKVTAIGQTFRGEAWAYNANEELTATLDTSYTFESALVNRAGSIGLAAYSSNHIFDNINVTAVPEPSSLMALASGLGLAAAAIRRRRA